MLGPRIEYPELERRYDRAMDAVGYLLRTFGAAAFDVEVSDARHITERCERWARHLTTGATHPASLEGRHANEQQGAVIDEQAHVRRDWRGLRRFFSAQRQRENDYVNRLRELLRQTMSRIEGVFRADDDDDKSIAIWLASLRHSAEAASLDELRKQVFATVDLVETSLSQRRKRHEGELQRLTERMTALRKQLDAAKHDAATDALTQLFNRGAFDTHVAATTQLARFTGEPASLLMVDIDHFKAINDAYGHQTGDNVLTAVADTIVRVASRRSDFVARYGGEEFAVVLADTPDQGARKVAERIVEAARKLKIQVGESPLCVTISLGLAELRQGESAADWIARADTALYRAKEEGRNRMVWA